MRALFVTGTGTDIGKTYVSAAIASYMTGRNYNLAYYKAAVSGSADIESSDAGFVKQRAALVQDTSSLLSYLYREPLSPHLVARQENRFASLDRIKNDFSRLAEKYDYVLSEGAGGIVCPVVYESGCRIFYADIIKALNVPCVIVADAGLGTINHTVLTYEYLKNHGMRVKGVILNRYDDKSLMHRDNLHMIEEITAQRVIATVGTDDSMPSLREKPLEDYFDEV